MSDTDDKWFAALLDTQLDTTKRCVDEINRLRRENKELRQIIANFSSTATELQDRVSLLETKLSKAKS